jgi:antitoxin component HigA of HigAB toxin-antitoxin module
MATRARATDRPVPTDSYFDLVKQFPLRKLRHASDYAAASKLSEELMSSGSADDLDAGQLDYLQALALIIQDYERSAFKWPRSRPAEIIRHLMEQRGMTPADVGRVLGSKSAASMILRGTREPSKAQIRKLAGHFRVSPALFI